MSFKHWINEYRKKFVESAKAGVIQIKCEPRNPKETEELLLKRVQICSMTYDYSDDAKVATAKLLRLTALENLIEFIDDTKNIIPYILPNLEMILEMIKKNIFRPLPICKKPINKYEPLEIGVDDQELIIDPAWSHLQGVYEVFLGLICCESISVKILKVYITSDFIQKFVEIFDSEEPRERDFLKVLLCRLYAKLVLRRKIIRKTINDCFLNIIHENTRFNGTSELLELFASFISGFIIPLREENVAFFINVIIPLHKVQTSHLFHEQLLRCTMLFLCKDHSLSILLLEGMLRYWPFGNSPKEIIFLTELNDVIEACELSNIEPLIPKLLKRLIRCISGPNLQVSDKAMQFFENEYFLGILKTFKQVTFPMIVPIIVDLAETHWHKILLESFNALKTTLKEIDPIAFDRVLQEPKDTIKANSLNAMHNIAKRSGIEAQWEALTIKAKTIDPSFVPPVIPYIENHVIGLHNMNSIELSSNNLIPLF